jgi:hypothetical protein
MSQKLVPTFEDRGCHVVSVMDSYCTVCLRKIGTESKELAYLLAAVTNTRKNSMV